MSHSDEVTRLREALETIVRATHDRRDLFSRQINRTAFDALSKPAADRLVVDGGEEWRAQQEANKTWSVYEGGAFRKGGFASRDAAERWMIDFRRYDAAIEGPGVDENLQRAAYDAACRLTGQVS